MTTLMERLAFLPKVPVLMKATTDDDRPCPGYLFEEIGKMCHESAGCCQCLLEYLLERLQVDSCHVKLKVLKILIHLCGFGSASFLTELRRNATFIQEVTVFSGPPDPVHGSALYQRVRVTAQELASLLFTEMVSPPSRLSPCTAATPPTGMGSDSQRSAMQGFGYSPRKMGFSGGSLLDKIQKAAEVMVSAVLPPNELPGIRLHDNHYRAVVAPSGAVEVAVPACAYTLPSQKPKAALRCPGQVGRGWEEMDSGHSSSTENGDISRMSGGTDSQSGASRESGDSSERVEAIQLGDCVQEMALIRVLVEGSKVFLSREESQSFIKECSTLNCEVVVELLSSRLLDPTHVVQMRALCAVACLMSSDLLSLEQILGLTHKALSQLSEGPPGPKANKATKLLLQFQALMGGQKGVARYSETANGHQPSSSNSARLPCTSFQSQVPLRGVAISIQSEGVELPSQFLNLNLTQNQRCASPWLPSADEKEGGAMEDEKLSLESFPPGTGPSCPPGTGPSCPPGTGPSCPPGTGPSCPPGTDPSCPPYESRSQFSRMEVVRKDEHICTGPLLCRDQHSEASSEVRVRDLQSVTQSLHRQENSSNTQPITDLTQSSEPVSAFSFLNL